MANNPSSAIDDFYEVNDRNDAIILSVKIGFRQNSASSVKINQSKLVPVHPNKKNDFGDFVRSFTVELGSNHVLDGKDLKINTIVHDVNDENNMTSIDITLDGGVKKRSWKLGPIQVDNGGIINYTAIIGFFKRNIPS